MGGVGGNQRKKEVRVRAVQQLRVCRSRCVGALESSFLAILGLIPSRRAITASGVELPPYPGPYAFPPRICPLP